MIKETGCTSETVNHYILRSMKSSVALIFFSSILISVRNHCVHTLLSYVFFISRNHFFILFDIFLCNYRDVAWSSARDICVVTSVSYCMLPRWHWQMPCDLSTRIFSSECIDLSRCPHVAASVGKELEHIDFICDNMHCQLCFFSLFVVKLVAIDVPFRAPDMGLMIKGKKRYGKRPIVWLIPALQFAKLRILIGSAIARVLF